MKPVQTTIILSSLAAVSLILAVSVNYSTLPETDDQHELIGEVFYPDFVDVQQATSMELVVWESEKKETRQFKINKVNDLWVIPDHSDYPVESPDRLRETAGSVMNITRLSLAGSSREEHDRLGVVDPSSDEAKLKDSQDIGDRIRLMDDSKNVICDFIIGKAVDAEAENEVSTERELVKGERYYIRQPDQNETYVARLDLNISTEFSEWIDSDLLQIGNAEVNKIQAKNYEVAFKPLKEFGGQRVPLRDKFEEVAATKEDFSWKLEGLKEETEEIESTPLDDLARQFKNLSIIDVRPKPTYEDSETKVLNGDLTVNLPEGVDRQDARFIQEQAVQVLGQEGFILGFEDETNLKSPSLLSRNGELSFATDDGLIYHLVFGNDVKMAGNSFEFAKVEDKEEKKDDGKTNEETDESPADKNEKQGKIMSVHVTFDETLIKKPSKPFPPIKPTQPTQEAPQQENQPEGDKPQEQPGSKPADDLNPGKKAPEKAKESPSPKTEKPATEKAEPSKEAPRCGIDELQEKEDAKQTPSKNTQEKEGSESKPPAKPESKPEPGSQEGPAKTSPAAGKQEPDSAAAAPQEKEKTPAEIFAEKMQAYEQALQQYQNDVKQFDEDMNTYEKEMKDYQKKIEDNRQKVDDLNARFADWFYIVDAENLSKIKLTRSDVVKAKDKKEDPKTGGLNLPNPGQLPPGLQIPNVNTPENPEAKAKAPQAGKPGEKSSPEKAGVQETTPKAKDKKPAPSAAGSQDPTQPKPKK
ncbi:MAG: DUF4340 domain-containing protein [Planctomycetota bacterium]|nr:DUF4340 domain-containing protein [Planctomycetota bacterium]